MDSRLHTLDYKRNKATEISDWLFSGCRNEGKTLSKWAEEKFDEEIIHLKNLKWYGS
jgi:hypothetical protein